MDSETRVYRDMILSLREEELNALLEFAGIEWNSLGPGPKHLPASQLILQRCKSQIYLTEIRRLYVISQGMKYSSADADPSAFQAMSVSSIPPRDKFVVNSSASFFGGCSTHQIQRGPDGITQTIMIIPDLNLKPREIPFCRKLGNIIAPSLLVGQRLLLQPIYTTVYSFRLSPAQARLIAESRHVTQEGSDTIKTAYSYSVQAQVRFFSGNSISNQEQEEVYPDQLCLKVNEKLVPLPRPIPSGHQGQKPKRRVKPLRITSHLKLSPLCDNKISVVWAAGPIEPYKIMVEVVKKMTANELLEELKTKIQPAVVTEARIREIGGQEEAEIRAEEIIHASVACPLGKCRMQYPCRATTCIHLQCFDGKSFLLMEERRGITKFLCPVCNNRFDIENLRIDGYFLEVIKQLGSDTGNEIDLRPDGTWTVQAVNEPSVAKIASADDIEIMVLDDAVLQNSPPKLVPKRNKETAVVDLVDSDEDVPPPVHPLKPPSPVPFLEERKNREVVATSNPNQIVDNVRPRRQVKKVNYAETSSR